MQKCTFAARIDSSRSVIQDSARAALRDFESASDILLRIAEETSVGCFFGKWEGMGKAMPQQTWSRDFGRRGGVSDRQYPVKGRGSTSTPFDSWRRRLIVNLPPLLWRNVDRTRAG